jgi:hypothetical protein
MPQQLACCVEMKKADVMSAFSFSEALGYQHFHWKSRIDKHFLLFT